MTSDEITAFLNQVGPALVGVIAIMRTDGSPHAVPVWYSWDGNTVSIWTQHDRAWVRNLRDDPRTAFTAQQATPPYGAVIIRGQAEARTGGGDIDTEIRRIVSRYLPPDDRQGYIAAWPHLQTNGSSRRLEAWRRVRRLRGRVRVPGAFGGRVNGDGDSAAGVEDSELLSSQAWRWAGCWPRA